MDVKIAGHKVTGVEGGNVGTNHGFQVPGNICGYSKKTGDIKNFPMTFTSQQINGKAPALLGLPSLIQTGAIINTRNHTMTIDVDGEDIILDLTLTRSGHYILPLNNFDENLWKKLSLIHI